MRTFLTLIRTFLLWLPLWAMASEDSGVEWTLTPTACSPGDVVELHARMTRPDFYELEIKLPETNGLHLVADQLRAVEYDNGIYTQQATWVMQPTRAGVIELKGVKAILKNGERVTEIELPTLALNVKGYGTIIDTSTPEPLPPVVPQEKDDSRKMIAIGITAFVLLVLLIVFRPKSGIPAPVQTAEPTLDGVRVAMEFGPIPTAMIEQLLANQAVSLPGTVRTALERAVYGRTVDHHTLLQLLREEAAR